MEVNCVGKNRLFDILFKYCGVVFGSNVMCGFVKSFDVVLCSGFVVFCNIIVVVIVFNCVEFVMIEYSNF